MINLDPITYIKARLGHMILAFVMIGLIFVLLGVGIIFFPQIIQYVFVIGFVLIGLSLFVVAIRISHIKDIISRFELFNK